MQLVTIAKSFLGLVILPCSLAAPALAIPLRDSSAYEMLSDGPTDSEVSVNTQNFLGTVALSNCSGALVQFGETDPTSPALVLTNGHCVERQLPQPGEVLVNIPSRRAFNLLDRAARNVLGTVNAKTMLYATMTDTDVALYLLDLTYEEIKDQYGIDPLTVTDQKPVTGTPISIVSGYWRRTYSCTIDGFVPELREDGWIFRDAIRYSADGCAVIGGTSGAPIIAGSDRTIVGINNTINENGARCTRNNPCEVDRTGNIVVRKGIGYGEQVYWFHSCLDSSGIAVDLQKPGCLLPKPK
ncbi:MAG: trypsin-like peptidase domain-containing protein [Deltaproteobacteria bacterium]|nr:trypsin-like peptidase domain-containing protein [Deltaproteobacteria bacterium]